MTRWEPNARGRLEQAAMELYNERGFESTTVAEIAERAGLTERTFFRYFVDKREVLFWGASALQELLVRNVEEAPGTLPPLGVIVWALQHAATDLFEERRDFARRRQAIISANDELQERELVKLAKLASALAEALRQRAVTGPAASLAAEAGIALFKVAFERWTADASKRTLSEIIRDCANDLVAVTAGTV
ncbi:MAG TPA: TetR family transcriptional regulator [Acidimicrobiales bacterium]|nr:TetR family transcriptional regulator [Acidimicrobiales bacterium]